VSNKTFKLSTVYEWRWTVARRWPRSCVKGPAKRPPLDRRTMTASNHGPRRTTAAAQRLRRNAVGGQFQGTSGGRPDGLHQEPVRVWAADCQPWWRDVRAGGGFRRYHAGRIRQGAGRSFDRSVKGTQIISYYK